MPDNVLASIIVAFAVAAVAAFSVTIPQAVVLVRLIRAGDPIAPYTLKTVAWTGTIGAAFTWRCLVFADFTYFGQSFMGRIEDRWFFEAVLSFLLAAAVIYAAILYHRTVTFGRRS